MENVKTSFEITPAFNSGTGSYEITNYDKLLESATKYINNILEKNSHEIVDEGMFMSLKEDRSEIRKQCDDIKKARLQINKTFFGTFNTQLKTIEKLIENADKQLKEKVDKWNNEHKKVEETNEPKVLSITITTFREDILNVVKEFALKKGCGVVENK